MKKTIIEFSISLSNCSNLIVVYVLIFIIIRIVRSCDSVSTTKSFSVAFNLSMSSVSSILFCIPHCFFFLYNFPSLLYNYDITIFVSYMF